MKILNSILLAMCAAGALPGIANAQQAQALMAKMAGVYKERFMSATITPGRQPGEADEPYQAENVIEIVPYDADHLYVRAHLEFYNGHSCDISGMARHEGKVFVYHDPEPPLAGDAPCALRVGIDRDRLILTDRDGPDGVASCPAYCGVRGSLSYNIGMDKRRAIRYLDRLKASRQYAKAIDDLRKTGSR
jgi:hypothetical protein